MCDLVYMPGTNAYQHTYSNTDWPAAYSLLLISIMKEDFRHETYGQSPYWCPASLRQLDYLGISIMLHGIIIITQIPHCFVVIEDLPYL